MQRLVLVGCGSKKRQKKSYSWDLYTSDYFQKKMTVAMLLGQPAILSAKHGYLPINKRVEPYEEDIRNKEEHERQSWALTVSSNIPNHFDEVIILAGKKYRHPLISFLKEDGYTVYSPFDSDGMRGNGDQSSWCKETANRIYEANESVLNEPI